MKSSIAAVSGLGLGTSSFGNLYRVTSDEASRAVTDAAWEAGIRYFDTAPHYGLGLSEHRLGAALARRPRDEYVISTKVGRLLVPDPSGAGRDDDEGFRVPASSRRVWDFTRDGVMRSVEESLTRLGLDRIDIAYLHDPDDHWVAASTTGVAALVELREQGTVRAIGVGMNQSAMLTEFVRRCDIDIVMVAGRYTLLDQTADEELFPLAESRGVAVVAAAVYNSGILSTATPAVDANYDYGPAAIDVVEQARAIAEVCQRHAVTLPTAALAFSMRHPAVTGVVIGAGTVEHLDQSVSRAQAEVPPALWGELEDRGLVRRLRQPVA